MGISMVSRTCWGMELAVACTFAAACILIHEYWCLFGFTDTHQTCYISSLQPSSPHLVHFRRVQVYGRCDSPYGITYLWGSNHASPHQSVCMLELPQLTVMRHFLLHASSNTSTKFYDPFPSRSRGVDIFYSSSLLPYTLFSVCWRSVHFTWLD